MKIHLMSDVHAEHMSGVGAFDRWLEDMARFAVEDDPDVLVLAGDIDLARGGRLRRTLAAFAAHWKRIVYVPGNHEHFGSDPAEVERERAQVEQEIPTLHWLSNSRVTLDGVVFYGGTMWYPPPPGWEEHERPGMVDYHQIRDFVPWVYQQNAGFRAGLHAAPSDVVVTHHMPAQQAVAPKWRGSWLNPFFVDDHSEFIRTLGPVAWLFGHTHTAYDDGLGGTRLVCNPKGYPDEIKTPYRPKLIEV